MAILEFYSKLTNLQRPLAFKNPEALTEKDAE